MYIIVFVHTLVTVSEGFFAEFAPELTNCETCTNVHS